MRRLIWRNLASLGAALLLFIVLAPSAHAEEGENITASPAEQRYTLDAGGTMNGSLNIINFGTVAYDFTLGSKDFTVKDEDYQRVIRDPTSDVDAGSWFQFPRLSYHLEPGQTVTVPYVIKAPRDASPGGHYAVVLASTKPGKSADGTIVTVKQVGVLFFLTVNGTYQEAGDLLDFDVDWWQTGAPLTAAVRMANTGNSHYDAVTQLKVTDLFGNVKYSYETSDIVLPKTVRRIMMKWDQAPPFGLFKVSGNVTFLGKTEPLKPRYVLMMSAPLFIAVVVVILILLAVALTNRRKHRGPRR